jgi:hypothetical protein
MYLGVYHSGGPAIEVVDGKINQVIGFVDISPIEIRQLIPDPWRARLYVSSLYPSPQIVVIDTRALRVISTIPLPSTTLGTSVMKVSTVTADGKSLYVTIDDTLAMIDLVSSSVVATKALGLLPDLPSALAVNGDRNELYLGVANGVLVFTADSLVHILTLLFPTTVYSIVPRVADGHLLVESDDGNGFTDTRVDAVDTLLMTGAGIVATSRQTGIGLAASVNGKELYRLRRGDYAAGQPYAVTSVSLVVLDSSSLATVASIPLDTRAAADPSRQGSAIVGTTSASLPAVSDAVEYFNSVLGHYFMTSIPAEISALDNGVFTGWQRTGQTIPVYAQRDDGPGGSVAVCRFYGLPEKGLNSHFYSASAAECAETQQSFGDSWTLESEEVFDVYPADPITGACLFDTTPVYRVFNNRPDANHRYTTSLGIRDSMVANGWIAEGYGPDSVAFCGPR